MQGSRAFFIGYLPLLNKYLQYLVVVLCMAAALISYNLLNKHIGGAKGPAWFEAGCSDQTESGGANCAAVLASPYSYYPPKLSDEPDGKIHIPVAFMGLIYYSILTVWFIGVGKPSYQRKRLHWIPLLLVGIGMVSSFQFTRIMFTQLNEWCPWCLITHILNLLIAVCVILMWPGFGKRKREAASKDQPQAESAPHPSRRLLLTTLVAIFATMYAQYNMLGVKHGIIIQKNYDQCLAVLMEFKKESEVLIRKWQKATPCKIVIRPDDVIRSDEKEGRPTLLLVVFSDFECPSCGRFAEFVENKIEPMFDGQLRVVFRHYPIDQSCNHLTGKTMHPHACQGAYLAEAARIVGGNDAFWKAHDYLFEHRHELKHGQLKSKSLADELKLDHSTLTSAMASEEVLSRIREDVEQAKVCAIRGTPAVFLQNKVVDRLAVTEITFWDAIADNFWKSAKIPRPEKTKLVNIAGKEKEQQTGSEN